MSVDMDRWPPFRQHHELRLSRRSLREWREHRRRACLFYRCSTPRQRQALRDFAASRPAGYHYVLSEQRGHRADQCYDGCPVAAKLSARTSGETPRC